MIFYIIIFFVFLIILSWMMQKVHLFRYKMRDFFLKLFFLFLIIFLLTAVYVVKTEKPEKENFFKVYTIWAGNVVKNISSFTKNIIENFKSKS